MQPGASQAGPGFLEKEQQKVGAGSPVGTAEFFSEGDPSRLCVCFLVFSCGHQREDKLVALSTGFPGFCHFIVLSPDLEKNKKDNQK